MAPYTATRRSLDRLDYYYQAIHATILSKQNPVSGLMPASVAITAHGDYTDAWVRDNVYSIYAVYGLALAYRRMDDDNGRAFELEHAVIKLMRGLLFAMMRQADKVEQFKKTQSLEHALHAKYNTSTGDTVVGDFEWGHLQIDATSLFLLALADMTTSGFTIVYTQDEVDFVQNLVFYIERAYRTPDYGIWERGNKSNHGQPELNSSSIGMALAAMRAINGVNMFGARGGPASVIHVLPDELTRNYTTLHSFLPRESNSKEIDGSILSIIGFPAFAVDDPDLIRRSKAEAREKLEGRFGLKRFLRDGHQTVLEDTTRLHYNLNELKIFENIESEWPLFFTYFILEGLFTGNDQQVEEYRKKLAPLILDSSVAEYGTHIPMAVSPGASSTSSKQSLSDSAITIPLIPELYYVSAKHIDAEKGAPHSQPRIPNHNVPLVWANSLYFLGCLIYEDLLSPSEVDPLGRRFSSTKVSRKHTVQIVLLSEDAALQRTLSMYGLETQVVDEIASSITVLHPRALTDVYAGLGRNNKLGLSGRPQRPIGVLGTSRLYRIQGHIYAFTPHFMDNEEFYLNSDPDYLISAFHSEISFTSHNWFYPGRPTMVVVLTNALLGSLQTPSRVARATLVGTPPVSTGEGTAWVSRATSEPSKKNLLNFFMHLRSGECNSVRVRLCRLTEAVITSNIESLDFLINQPDMNWESILRVANHTVKRRRSISIHRKLAYNESETQATTPGSKTPRRRNTTFHGKSLASPIDKLHDDSYFAEIANALSKLEADSEPRFKLKDPENSPIPSMPRKAVTHIDSPSRIDDSDDARASPAEVDRSVRQNPTPPSMDMLSLVLGDPSQFAQAVESLTASVNLYDQIDLLQYLESCKGIHFYISELEATIRELIEEVYLKAMRLHYWSIVRQAAGLLGKIVPSLTISVTDLVIQQKQLSIGSGAQEYLISMPTGPDALSKMVSEHCNDDIREGPVVQEIIIYLGTLIRTMPHLFDGILRLRTHYIIIALREEISRVNGCDEEEAVEHLMQLSPSELQSLLGTILSGPHISSNGADSSTAVTDTFGGDVTLSQILSDTPLTVDTNVGLALSADMLASTTVESDSSNLVIRVQSAGYKAGNFVQVDINGSVATAHSRGIHVWAIYPGDKVVLQRASFDTHIAYDESLEFARFIDWLCPGTIVVIAVKDDFTEHLNQEAIGALQSLGSQKIKNVGYRDSFALIAEKGAPPEQTVEDHVPADGGPTRAIERRFAATTKGDSTRTRAPSPASSLAHLFPNSNGRWLRRRKNDGALNRVPPQFFPQTWQILDCSRGLRIFHHTLPRDPTVLEKTAEEFNFALVVEGFLAWFTDPAERQVAVETLSVVFRLKERNPELKMDDEVDVSLIMDKAIEFFWNKWTGIHKRQLEANMEQYGIHGLSYEANKGIARKLFYDLPQHDSTESTFAYLAKSALKVLPIEFHFTEGGQKLH